MFDSKVCEGKAQNAKSCSTDISTENSVRYLAHFGLENN